MFWSYSGGRIEISVVEDRGLRVFLKVILRLCYYSKYELKEGDERLV